MRKMEIITTFECFFDFLKLNCRLKYLRMGYTVGMHPSLQTTYRQLKLLVFQLSGVLKNLILECSYNL